MRKTEKIKARALREQGFSIKEIERKLGVRRSSVSVWVRDIELTKLQRKRLSLRGLAVDVMERRRQTRQKHENARRMRFLQAGHADIFSREELDIFMLGVGLFWGEGSKTNRGTIELSNTDPRIIQIFVKFLTAVCGLSRSKLRGHVGIHSHLSIESAEKYWSGVSGIPRSQFSKTSFQKSRAGKGERDPLPYGTFSVAVHVTEARIRLEGWIQGIHMRLFPHETQLHNLTKLRI